MFTVTTPISPPAEAKLPEFTPPPDILPPLKSEIGGDCTPLVVAAGPRAANKLPSSKSLSNEKGCESVSNALTAPASRMTAESAILPPGSASTGYTNTAVLGSDSLSSSPTPPVVENGGSDNLTPFQPSSLSQSVNPPSSARTNVQVNPLESPPNTQLPNYGQMLPPPSDDSRPPQQVFISQAQRAIPVCHNYISVQQVQQLRPLPNNSNYTRIETGLSSNLKSPDTDFESKPQMGIQQP